MTTFLRLDDLLVSPPLSACLAVLMCVGLKYLGNRLASVFFGQSPHGLELGASIILVTGLIAVLSNFMGLLGLAHVWPLRCIAWGIAVCGMIELIQLGLTRRSDTVDRMWNLFQAQNLGGKALILLLTSILILLALASLGPPTDEDSLNYHLGVPLDILSHHGAYPRPDWFHARLVGLGESLNMLGLAAGTDVFGATLQFSGLIISLIAVMSMAKSDSDSILAAVIVLGCPVLVSLTTLQKPQMLPIAGTTVALIMIIRRFESMDHATMTLALTSVCFAMSCKYSFLLSGSVVILTGMVASYRNGNLKWAIGIALVAFMIFLFPIYLQKYIFYGDPISPLLESFLFKDPAVVKFADRLKDFRDSPRPFPFPLFLVLPDSIGTISKTLGLGVLLVLTCPWMGRSGRRLILCSVVVAILTYFMGQAASRFFLEPYLWIAAAFVGSGLTAVKPLVLRIMVLQLLGVTAIVIFTAATLFPGALSSSLRHQVMLKCAFQYAESKWLESVLPKNIVVLTDLGSAALIPRPFMLTDPYYYSQAARASVECQRISDALRQQGVNTWITFETLSHPCLRRMFPALVSGPKVFRTAARNPWNASTSTIAVYRSEEELP